MDGNGNKAEARPGTRGFILVMLLVFITVMGIFLTIALPPVATEVQRDQEAELIFRGEAIAAAIRLYKARTGGYPLALEDLTKVRPRTIRKLYMDPMSRKGSQEGDWDLITAVQPGASGDKTGLPIVGVKSFCQKDSFTTYHDKTLISDWTFSAADNLLGIPGAAAAAGLLQTATGQAPQGAAAGQQALAPGKTGPGNGVDASQIPIAPAPQTPVQTPPQTPPQAPPQVPAPAPDGSQAPPAPDPSQAPPQAPAPSQAPAS